jgi:hypothetical protein
VHVELLIETIWLRNWTEELMPDTVKKYVGLMKPDPDDKVQTGRHPGLDVPGRSRGIAPDMSPRGGGRPY